MECESQRPEQPPLYRAAVVSDQPLRVEFRTTAVHVLEYLQAIERCGWTSRMAKGSANVLLVLLGRVNGELLAATGKMLAWPLIEKPRHMKEYAGSLGEATGYGRSALYAAIKDLTDLGCLTKARIEWRGRVYDGWEICAPEGDQPAGGGRLRQSGNPDGGVRVSGRWRALSRTVARAPADESSENADGGARFCGRDPSENADASMKENLFFEEEDLNLSHVRQTDDAQRSAEADRQFDEAFAGMPHIPDCLDTEEFRRAWREWLAHLHERCPRVSVFAVRLQLADAQRLGVVRAVAAIRHSIAGNYQRLVEEIHHARTQATAGPGATPGAGATTAAPAAGGLRQQEQFRGARRPLPDVASGGG